MTKHMMSKDLTALIITPEPAWPVMNGWDARNYQLIRAMAGFSKFDVVTLAHPVLHIDQKETCDKLKARSLTVIRHSPPSYVLTALKSLITSEPMGPLLFRSEGLHSTVAALSARNRYDVCLILGNLCMAEYAADAQALMHVLDMCDDVAHYYDRRALIAGNGPARAFYRGQAKMLRSYLRRESLGFNRILAICELDANSIAQEVDVPVVSVPNCVDSRHFRPAQSGASVPHDPLLLFVGSMDYWPNRDAVDWFTSSVMPRILQKNPDTRLQLVGPGTKQFTSVSPSVVLRGFVENLAAEYRACDVFVCPIRVGTGIKNKLMEALASGCAIVSTDIGIEGLALRNGEHLLIANDPIEFAHAVNSLLCDSALRTRLGNAARAYAEEALSEGISCNLLRAAMLPNDSVDVLSSDLKSV
jgi:glycosyltransferase involved in cell wall biosynthesis